MKMSKLLLDYRKELVTLDKELIDLRRDFKNKSRTEREIFEQLKHLLIKYPANLLVIKELLLILQLLNDHECIDEYSLNDLNRLFQKSVAIYPNDIDLGIEYFHYLDVAMSQPRKAQKHLKALRSSAEKMLYDKSLEDEF